MGKLTKAQRELLVEANCLEGVHCVDTYAPAVKLLELGLAEWTHRRFASTLRATDLGRAALSEGEP